MTNEHPLILTLDITETGMSYFNELRQQHFPAEKNFLAAHLTLFHKLPDQPSVIDTIRIAAREHPNFQLQVTTPVMIGNGVAFKIESKALQQLHLQLQQQWQEVLSPQDSKKLWPHITVQNKVTSAVAAQLFRSLSATFTPFTIDATGFRLWQYLADRGRQWIAFISFLILLVATRLTDMASRS